MISALVGILIAIAVIVVIVMFVIPKTASTPTYRDKLIRVIINSDDRVTMADYDEIGKVVDTARSVMNMSYKAMYEQALREQRTSSFTDALNRRLP